MAIRTYKVTLDTKNAIAPEPVYLRQGDKTGAVMIDATLMDNGAPISISGLTPMFKANTADGKAVIADSTGFNIVNASGGEFTYQVTNALSSVPGKITTAYFSLSDSSGSESTFDVAFIIKKAVDITQAQADDYITIIDGTIQSLQQKIDAMNTDVQTILNNYKQGDFYNKAQTDEKLGKAELETENLSLIKMDKNTTDISIHQINKNKGLLDETYMTEEFKQQMAGTTPVNAVPAKGSIVQSMNAYPAIEGKESFNKFNPATITTGMYIFGSTGAEVALSGYNESDYIKVSPSKKYFISVGEKDANLHIVWYDANKHYISGISGASGMGNKNVLVTSPTNAVYARLSVRDSQLTNLLFCESDVYQEYQPFNNLVTANTLDFKPAKIIKTKNLFNKNAVTKGKYILYSSGYETTKEGYNASEFIPVRPTTDYTYRKGFGNPEQLAFYDINKRYISGIAAPTELITTPEDAYFVRATVKDVGLDTFLFGEGIVSDYEPFGAFIPKDQLYPDASNDDEPTTLVVAQDGSGNFTSIYDAVSSIKDSGKNKRYRVLIHEGEYNMISELPTDMVDHPTIAIGNRGLELPPFVDLIGVGIKEKIILKGELLNPTADQAMCLSTVNYYSSNRLENLTITAKNMRYPIHADGNRGACHYVIDNCDVIHYGNDAGLWTSCHAFASGFGSGSRLEMHNSKFITYGTDAKARAWSTHNWDNLAKPSTVDISECELLNMNDGMAVFFGSMGSGQKERALIKNSYVKGSIVNVENEAGSGVGIEFTVESYNLATTVTSY